MYVLYYIFRYCNIACHLKTKSPGHILYRTHYRYRTHSTQNILIACHLNEAEEGVITSLRCLLASMVSEQVDRWTGRQQTGARHAHTHTLSAAALSAAAFLAAFASAAFAWKRGREVRTRIREGWGSRERGEERRSGPDLLSFRVWDSLG